MPQEGNECKYFKSEDYVKAKEKKKKTVSCFLKYPQPSPGLLVHSICSFNHTAEVNQLLII